MAMNKSGKGDLMTVLVWVAIALVVAYVANFNGFQDTVAGWMDKDSSSGSGDNQVDLISANCPTDGTSTFTVNVQDALTSTATNVDSEYYVFNGNKLIKEGTTGSDGTVDVDVACGKDYKLLLLNTTADDGAYSKIVDLKARISEDTVNEELVRFGNAKILGIENPADPSRNANVSLSAGATKNFDIKFVANLTDRGYNKPIIMCQVNISSIQKVELGSFSDGSAVTAVTALPKRITASAGYQYYAWEYPKMLTPAQGVITASGSITALASVTPSELDSMTCKIVDQATWKTSGYKTTTSIEAGFLTGPENTETLADVGGADSSTASYNFVHSGGY